jgi:hypothetical protein
VVARLESAYTSPVRTEDVDGTLAGLIGLPLWSAAVGTERDPTLSLELGPERRRATRLANPDLSFVKRTFEGTHALLVEGAWRVERAGRPLTSARSPGSLSEGRELPALSRARVVAARLDGVDLVLDLDDDRRLRAIVLGLGAKDPSWTLTTPTTIVTVVGGRLDLTARPREKPRLAAVEDDDAPVVTAWLSRRGAEPRSAVAAAGPADGTAEPAPAEPAPAEAPARRAPAKKQKKKEAGRAARGATPTKARSTPASASSAKPSGTASKARASAKAPAKAGPAPRAGAKAQGPAPSPSRAKPRATPKRTPPRGLRPVR